jgi:hypothetical protein
MLDNLEIEIKRWNQSYSFSSEDNDRKRVYTIYSPELKKKLREIISPYGTPIRVGFHYEGKNSQGDCILYQQGSNDNLPDQLTLVSKEIAEQRKITNGTEQQKEKKSWENWDTEWEQARALWKRQEAEMGASPGVIKSYFSGKNKDGEKVMEGTYIQSENRSQITVMENKTFPLQIQGIVDNENKELEKVETDDKKEKDFILHQQILPKKG